MISETVSLPRNLALGSSVGFTRIIAHNSDPLTSLEHSDAPLRIHQSPPPESLSQEQPTTSGGENSEGSLNLPLSLFTHFELGSFRTTPEYGGWEEAFEQEG